MDLAQCKQLLQQSQITQNKITLFHNFFTPSGAIDVFLTERLIKRCRKAKVWKSRAMLSTLKNVQYGFCLQNSRSRGGIDGIFRLDRHFKPANSMMKKLFDQFLDKPSPLKEKIQSTFSISSEKWIPVRLVSHHLRLLGVIICLENSQVLVLVDCDCEKGN